LRSVTHSRFTDQSCPVPRQLIRCSVAQGKTLSLYDASDVPLRTSGTSPRWLDDPKQTMNFTTRPFVRGCRRALSGAKTNLLNMRARADLLCKLWPPPINCIFGPATIVEMVLPVIPVTGEQRYLDSQNIPRCARQLPGDDYHSHAFGRRANRAWPCVRAVTLQRKADVAALTAMTVTSCDHLIWRTAGKELYLTRIGADARASLWNNMNAQSLRLQRDCRDSE